MACESQGATEHPTLGGRSDLVPDHPENVQNCCATALLPPCQFQATSVKRFVSRANQATALGDDQPGTIVELEQLSLVRPKQAKAEV